MSGTPRRPPLPGARQLSGLPDLALLLLALPLVAKADAQAEAEADCPCEEPTLCRPIRHHPDHEVFAFDAGHKTWKFYDWSQITTVANVGKNDSELMCHAHSKGARVVLKEDVPIKDIIDPTFRASWIAKKLNLAKEQHMDGINLYIGQKVHCSTPEYDALTALVKETTEAFHREIEGSQVTVDVNWSPKHNNLSCYNYTGIADASDFVFVMSFGKRNPVGIAAANAPYKQILTGYEDYISMGINPRKLVMGVPWYGYDYTCLKLSADHVCTTTKVPLLTASYQGFSRRLVSYKVIMKYLKTSTSGIQWNEDQQAPYYNYQDSAGSFHQVWYDNPRSISLKVSYVVKNGLRGIGMWHANSLDYSEDATAKQQTEEMWQVLKPQWTFLKPKL